MTATNYYGTHAQQWFIVGASLRPFGQEVAGFRRTMEDGSPDTPQNVSELKRDVLLDAVKVFYVFTWRVGMALCAAVGSTRIALHEVFTTFLNPFPDCDELVRQLGWAQFITHTIDWYRDTAAICSFQTFSELRQMAPKHLHEFECDSGDCERAGCCPLLTWERQR